LRSAFAATRKNYPFDIVAIVVLADHLHAVWTLPPDDADFSTRWRLIKTRFAKALPDRERRSAVRVVPRARRTRHLAAARVWRVLFNPPFGPLTDGLRSARGSADYARPYAFPPAVSWIGKYC